MEKVMILLTIKLKHLKFMNNNRKVIIKGIEKIIEKVECWVTKDDIARVVDFNRMTRREDFMEIEE